MFKSLLVCTFYLEVGAGFFLPACLSCFARLVSSSSPQQFLFRLDTDVFQQEASQFLLVPHLACWALWNGQGKAVLQTPALFFSRWMQPFISHGHITSADGVSREARRSIGLPAAQGMKFLSLRNENEVLEGGKLLLPASEPANTSQLARRAG